MATAYTKIDALGLYLSGASMAGGAQSNPSACLGGYRSNTEAKRRGFLVKGGNLRPIRIDWVSGNNAVGEGLLLGDGASTLRWQAPGPVASIAGISITNGQSKLVESATATNAIRVTRMSTDGLKGLLQVQVVNLFNGVLGFDNISSADATAGKANYRAAFLYNHSDASITGIKLWIKTLGTQRATGTAQLGGAGSGTITTATADGFADWPTCGWAHIKDSGGTTREIVYYTTRTATSLTVPAAGRARLGTSAGAGSATDTVDAVPGIRIGLEAPVSNAIQTVASETTAPTGITWNVQTTSAAGLSIATLTTGSEYGLWIHRDTPAGTYAAAQVENAINIEFVYSAVTYSTSWSGLYRIANNALRLYELYSGTDAEPTFTTASGTSASLPFNYALTPPGSGSREYYTVVRYRNAYNLVSQNVYSRKTKINSAGALVVKSPSAPTNVSLTDAGGGLVRIHARYESLNDDPQANQWSIRLRGDGTNPDGTETPDYVDMTLETGFFARRIPMPLNTTIGPFAEGQDLRVLLRSRHYQSGAESTNTTATTLTVGSGTVGLPLKTIVGFGIGQEYRRVASSIAGTEVIDSTNNIYWAWDSGYLELWANTDLIFRLRYDSAQPTNNGFWTTYGFVQETITGTPATEPVEVASWTVGSKVIYISANGVRRMKIDHTNNQIHFAAMNQYLTRASSPAVGPVLDATFRTLFQVYDPSTSGYVTALDLDYDGILRMAVGWKQRGTVGAFS